VEELSQFLGDIEKQEVAVEHDASAAGAQCISLISVAYVNLSS
jgi:hypothetical protein